MSRALLAMALLVLTGCGGGEGDDVSDPDSSARLEQQRTDVRAASARVLTSAEETLGATVVDEVGRYEGCTSRAPEGYRDVRYLAEARVDLPRDDRVAPPYVVALAPALADAGLAAGDPHTAANGFVTVTGRGDQLESTLTWTGAGPFVLLRVQGPCVPVGAEEWAGWTDRTADAPLR